MKNWWKQYAFLAPAMAVIAWILPQSLFVDCVRPDLQTVSNETYTVEEYQKMFDFSDSEIEIAWGWKEMIKGFRSAE